MGIVGLLYSFSFAAMLLSMNRDFYHDDAYITLRYARHFLSGEGIVWNPGEYVQGYTNFLHLMLVSLCGFFGMDLVFASRFTGVMALVGLLASLYFFGRHRHSPPTDPLLGIIVVVPVLLSAPMLVWSLGGLEGPLFALLVTVSCVLFSRALAARDSVGLYAVSGILFGLTVLTRPDGLVFLAVSFLWLAWRFVVKRSGSCSNLVYFTAASFAFLVPFYLWQFLYYGDIVPNTFYAKAGIPLNLRLAAGLSYIVEFLTSPPYLAPLTAITFSIVVWRGRLRREIVYPCLLVCAFLLSTLVLGGDHMPAFRLLLPVIPLLGIILFLSLSTLEEHQRGVFSLVIFCILLSFSSFQLNNDRLNPGKEDSAAFYGRIVGEHIAATWPAGVTIALNTAGSTPYFTPQNRYIDMLGLNDATIARRRIGEVRLTRQRWPGHLKGDGAYVLSRSPDFIIIGPAYGAPASQPWFLSDLELSENPQFHEHYTVCEAILTSPELPNGEMLFVYYRRKVQ